MVRIVATACSSATSYANVSGMFPRGAQPMQSGVISNPVVPSGRRAREKCRAAFDIAPSTEHPAARTGILNVFLQMVLFCGPAAIDHEQGSSDKGSFIRREIQRSIGNFIGSPHASYR